MHHSLHLPSFTLVALCLLAAGTSAQGTYRVSESAAGIQADGGSYGPAISADGRFVAFRSGASNLVRNDGNQRDDIFVRDSATGWCEAVSVDITDATGNEGSYNCSISADGRFVAFSSMANNLVTNDLNGMIDVFVRDLVTHTTRLISVSSTGSQGNSHSHNPAISADGRYIAFRSSSSNLVAADLNHDDHIFVCDTLTMTTDLASVNSTGEPANKDSLDLAISADGRFVAFVSIATNLVPRVIYPQWNVFVHDRLTGDTESSSMDPYGQGGNGHSRHPSITADGRFVCFQSEATNLVLGDTNSSPDIFLHDRALGMLARVNLTFSGLQSTGGALDCDISEDGRFIAFASIADDLAPGGHAGAYDVFLRDNLTATTSLISSGAGSLAINKPSFAASVSADASRIALQSNARDLISDDTNKYYDIFLRNLGPSVGSTANGMVITGAVHVESGQPLEVSFFAAPPGGQWWLLASAQHSGSIISGHLFEVGPGVTVVARGLLSTRGTGKFVIPLVPVWTSGRTLYVELGARDAGGAIYDSNTLERIVQ